MSIYRLKGTSGPLINQAFPLAGRLLLGKADDCHVRISHDETEPHHAEIILSDDGRVLLRHLGAGQTRLNGEPVNEAELSGGDEIQVGNCRLMLQAPGLRPDRVLDDTVIKPGASHWPWLLLVLAGSAAVLAWQYGYLDAALAVFTK